MQEAIRRGEAVPGNEQQARDLTALEKMKMLEQAFAERTSANSRHGNVQVRCSAALIEEFSGRKAAQAV